MYYIIRVDNVWRAVYYRGEYSDSLYSFLKSCGLDIAGQFGREDYAIAAIKNMNEKEL